MTRTDVAIADTDIPKPAETKEGTHKKRLISYSSQDSNSKQEKMATRRTGRKCTAITKIDGVMIDHISKKTD